MPTQLEGRQASWGWPSCGPFPDGAARAQDKGLSGLWTESGGSFSSLIVVARISKTTLNSHGETGHPCLVLDLRGNSFRFSPLRIMFAVGLPT